MPAIYAVCEVIREWLVDNNVKGLDDESMHAQMMRRAKEAERSEVRLFIDREWIRKDCEPHIRLKL